LNQTEMAVRYEIFRHNLDTIASLNNKHSPRTKFAINKFADLSQAEFKKLYLSTKPEMPEGLPEQRQPSSDDLGHHRAADPAASQPTLPPLYDPASAEPVGEHSESQDRWR